MADVQPLYLDSDGLPVEMADTDSLDLSALAMSGNITMSSNEVTGLPATPSATGAASKEYVDSVASGLDPKASCRLATAATLTSWVASGSGVGKTLTAPTTATSHNDFDSVTSVVSDRILVKDGPAGADNGIYTVTLLGDAGSNSCTLTRATDCDQDAEVTGGAYVWVNEGTAHADTSWVITTNDAITVDTTAITWSQFGGVGTYTGGDGIAISTYSIAVDLATNPGLEFSSNKLQAKAYNGITVDANGVGVTAYNGITVDSNGVSVNAGSGLVANAGPGDLDIDLATGAVIEPGLQFGTGGDAGKIGVLPDPAGAIDVLSAGLHIRTDDSTIQINGSNELTVIGATDSVALKEEVTANENVSAGDPVFWGGANDEVKESMAGTATRRRVMGVMEDSVSAASTGTVVRYGPCTGVLTTATVGTRYFLASGGGLTTTPPTSTGDAVWFIGYAINADDLDVQPQMFIRARV